MYMFQLVGSLSDACWLTCSFGKHFSLSGDHTESVQIEYDPKMTNYSNMLRIFWENHDSTRCASRQYMSAIFYHNEDQKKLAEQTRDEKQKTLSKKIVTRITEAETFYDAEKWVVYVSWCVCLYVHAWLYKMAAVYTCI